MPVSKPLFKIVCDVETSGSCPIRNGVIAACFLIIDENCNVIDEFVRYVRPPELSKKWWSNDAQGIHGMTYEQVETYMPNDQFCYELLIFLGKYKGDLPFDFICHASPGGWFDGITKEWKIVSWFDYNFILWCFNKAKFSNGQQMVWSMYKVIHPNHLISTVKMGRDAGSKKNKLNLWAERLNFELKHHDPTSDTYCALEVYKYLKASNEQKNDFRNKLQASI